MTRSLLQLFVALVLTFGSTVWADDSSTPPKSMSDRMTAVETLAKAASDSANELVFNAGDNCWVLVSSALVLLMTLPGLALFYGGMVRSKNVLATLMQSLTITSLVSVLWALVGYSIAFGPGPSETHNKVDDKGVAIKDPVTGLPVPETLPLPSANFWGGMSYSFLDHVITESTRTMPGVNVDATGKLVLKTPAAFLPVTNATRPLGPDTWGWLPDPIASPAPTAAAPGSTALVPGPNGIYCGSINHGSYMLFQLMFAIITPALIAGGYAERMKFSSMCVFSSLWLLFVYCPLAHMMWGENGYFNWATPGFVKSSAFDFAGGTVVHISSGIAALMCALFLGKRKGYEVQPMKPHNLTMSFVGASLLWVGWFGFNSGSALQAGGLAVLAFANTHFATAAAALGWPLAEWLMKGKPTMMGGISGAVAGLVAVTPASGFVTPMGALTLGFIAGVLCMITSSYMKKALGFYDDSLDAFGVHACGGMWGAISTGIFFNVDTNPGIAGLQPRLVQRHRGQPGSPGVGPGQGGPQCDRPIGGRQLDHPCDRQGCDGSPADGGAGRGRPRPQPAWRGSVYLIGVSPGWVVRPAQEAA
jgi:ammonia channel protein AmtB